SPPAGHNVTIFYRDDARVEPVQMASRTDLGEVIARLGGDGAPEEERLDFTYGEIVAVLQALSRQRQMTAARPDGRLTLAPFVFEQPGGSQDLIESAPVIEQSRPNTDGAAKAEVRRMKDEG
ncbi:MAG: hypothetical protein M3Q55_03935, partial [Acidobacteriota bacterium]|nr:hypothetical protein [Acidobacteriota bacterium]